MEACKCVEIEKVQLFHIEDDGREVLVASGSLEGFLFSPDHGGHRSIYLQVKKLKVLFSNDAKVLQASPNEYILHAPPSSIFRLIIRSGVDEEVLRSFESFLQEYTKFQFAPEQATVKEILPEPAAAPGVISQKVYSGIDALHQVSFLGLQKGADIVNRGFRWIAKTTGNANVAG
mmetsp:Transcript_41034/g.66536  ORF Transcript_41034/g.66536 Transcript_41034/m.66536 type:complete len:175 (-) Transcript_41034:673-1197(-)|eukprot:CAMPEP_0184648488 /NCGR_PEP_ID=MMETSP0308-20130426/5618_1 /TAXON_ID=38269 /ORGANISM="Gloeochaete witrockiana, Strain SAG 46.84" /LENGTH=174 /DNA_ID=CAMNT_0027080349 /DNA_START=61 /DNA_END=585 /DNA_ORIENTATION=+